VSDDLKKYKGDSLVPPEMAKKSVEIGIKRSTIDFWSTFLLAVRGGAFIGLGAMIATVVGTGGSALPYGVNKLLMGLVFSLGLILIIIGGAELFTGNSLMIMAVLDKKISLGKMLRNWAIVYLGNFIGGLILASLIFLTRQYTSSHGELGLLALNIAEAKTSLAFWQALVLGIMCNALVCLAIWMSYSARTTTGKILAIIPPITAFVAAGFEHSIANMYYMPIALLIKYFGSPDFFSEIGKTASDFSNLTIKNFLVTNLIPVTIGNIIGGGLIIGGIYWFIYLRKDKKKST
jgi:formate transporter